MLLSATASAPARVPYRPADAHYLTVTGGLPPMVGCLLTIAGRPPDVAELRAGLAPRIERVTALSRHWPVPFRSAREFEHVGSPQLLHHVRQATVDRLADWPGLLERLWAQPLPADRRPPWDLWLVRSPEDGSRYALLFRVHHALLDGVATTRVVTELLGLRPPDAASPSDSPAPRSARPSAADVSATAATGAAADVLRGYRTPLTWPAPDDRPGRAPRFGFARLPLSLLRAAGRPAGATVNDVYLAGWAGALRSWQQIRAGSGSAAESRPEDLPVRMPVSTRHLGPPSPVIGNRVISERVVLPCAEPDPGRRLRAVARQTALLRPDHRRIAAQAAYDRLSFPLASWIARRSLRPQRGVMSASNVRMSAGPLSFRGAPVLHAVALGPIAPGHHCYSMFTGYHDTAYLYLAHTDRLPHAERLPALWLRAVHELHEASCR
ncbi:wax ester/triacylglycerol synthase domain-containing protein [Streptomyces syringium]|uniref:wax ester/triacylglycerol synthase domain-containing protein n=1 Tax=Streptomyces syringium TaxID=76729 RepID=UPI003D90961A